MPTIDVLPPDRFWCPLFVTHSVVRATPSGELDIATIPVLDEALRRAMGHADVIVMDLSELTFIDSIGARLLLAVARRVGWSGGRLILENVPPHVDRVFGLLGVDRDTARDPYAHAATAAA